MMGWLLRFFNKRTDQQQQADSSSTSTSMTQVVVEQTIMTAANWLIHFVNRSLEPKVNASAVQQSEPSGNSANAKAAQPAESVPDTVETLVARLGALLEQADDRNQATAVLAASLEERLNAIEASLRQTQQFNQQINQQLNQQQTSQQQFNQQINQQVNQQQISQQQISHQLNQLNQLNQSLSQEIQELKTSLFQVEDRLVPVENFAEHSDSIISSIAHTQQGTKAIANRMTHVEKLLAQFRLIPRLVEGNYRAIAAVQHHLEHFGYRSLPGGEKNEGETANVVSIAKAR